MDDIQRAVEAADKGSINPVEAAIELLNTAGASVEQQREAANFILNSTIATEGQKAFAEQALFEIEQQEAEKASGAQFEAAVQREVEKDEQAKAQLLGKETELNAGASDERRLRAAILYPEELNEKEGAYLTILERIRAGTQRAASAQE